MSMSGKVLPAGNTRMFPFPCFEQVISLIYLEDSLKNTYARPIAIRMGKTPNRMKMRSAGIRSHSIKGTIPLSRNSGLLACQ